VERALGIDRSDRQPLPRIEVLLCVVHARAVTIEGVARTGRAHSTGPASTVDRVGRMEGDANVLDRLVEAGPDDVPIHLVLPVIADPGGDHALDREGEVVLVHPGEVTDVRISDVEPHAILRGFLAQVRRCGVARSLGVGDLESPVVVRIALALFAGQEGQIHPVALDAVAVVFHVDLDVDLSLRAPRRRSPCPVDVRVLLRGCWCRDQPGQEAERCEYERAAAPPTSQLVPPSFAAPDPRGSCATTTRAVTAWRRR